MFAPSIKTFLQDKVLRIRKKEAFLRSLEPRCSILDVGCGNNSPHQTKSILPMCRYTGLDIGDYNQTRENLADDYILVSPEDFARKIAEQANRFDVVISSHNLEHCNDRHETLQAMMAALKPSGRIYLAFPSEASVTFSGSRAGCLNYYDDPTHKDAPPKFNDVIQLLQRQGFRIDFSTRGYKHPFLWLRGFLNEHRSKKSAKIEKGTWEYYGFEALVWARKSDLSK